MTCQLPDPFHVKRPEALDIAAEILEIIELKGRVCLYVDSNGVVQVSHHVLDVPDPFSLVGVYDDASTLTQIAEDIIAMQREPVHGKAEA